MCKEIKREKKGRIIKKLVTYLMLLLCCFYVLFFMSWSREKKVKKRDLYRKISFDISKFKIKNNLRIT